MHLACDFLLHIVMFIDDYYRKKPVGKNLYILFYIELLFDISTRLAYTKKSKEKVRRLEMKKVASKLTSKFQLTLPKTIRNILEINDYDFVDFVIEDDGKVYVEKGKPKMECPICKNGVFFGNHCNVCNGDGYIENISNEILLSTLFKSAMDEKAKIGLESKDGIYYIKLDTNNELLMLYREKIQLEIIKNTIIEFRKKNMAIPIYSEVEKLLEDKFAKADLSEWYSKTFQEGEVL